ncbi:MAG: hypothetical protein Q9170_005949 [Blastenia crenularia]
MTNVTWQYHVVSGNRPHVASKSKGVAWATQLEAWHDARSANQLLQAMSDVARMEGTRCGFKPRIEKPKRQSTRPAACRRTNRLSIIELRRILVPSFRVTSFSIMVE